MGLSNVALGQIQAKEHLGLVIEQGLRRVHELAQVVIIKWSPEESLN